MTVIDPTARIAAGAVLGQGVEVGPFCTVGPHVRLGDRVKLRSHVVIEGHTSVGARTVVHPFAVLGGPPQSLRYKGEPSRLEIGADGVIRESVTVNTGTEAGGMVTRIGDRCFMMAYSHVAHDCQVGHDVIFANSATLAGHCSVGNYVFIGGLAAAHQFLRIGSYAMIGGLTPLDGDVIPFGNAFGGRGELQGLNLVGLKRRGFTRAQIHTLRRAFRELFHGPGTFAARIDAVAAAYPEDPAVGEIIAFLRAGGKRRVLKPKGTAEGGDAEG